LGSVSQWHSVAIVTFVAILGAMAVQPALAESVGLQNQWCLNPPAGSPNCGVTGLQASGPITNTNSNTFVFGPGATFTGSMTETSDYGNLSVSGSGTVTNSATGGALGHVGEYNAPGFDVGGSPLAFYEDLLTITGTGPVNVQFTDVFSSSLFNSADAQVSLTDELMIGGVWDNFLYSSGTATNVFTFNPGDQVLIREGILGGGDAYAPNVAPPAISPSFSYSGSGPLYIDVLTPGGGYIADSGTLYPTFDSSVTPEPGSFFLLGSGLISIAGFVRSRQVARS
jgi:hypothetical protein